MQLIGVLGGTFDPIHNGHVNLAIKVLEILKLDEIRLIPSSIPPHRIKPVASTTHRKKMVELAIYDEKKLSIDLREIKNGNISYTINTLKSLRKEFPDVALFLIIGEDVFSTIDSWKNWQSLLDFTNIVVAKRPSNNEKKVSHKLNEWIEKNKINDISLLTSSTSGYIYYIDTPIIDISSTKIRKYYNQYKNVDKYLSSKVITYIRKNNLYINN